jgi:hypothetical protein
MKETHVMTTVRVPHTDHGPQDVKLFLKNLKATAQMVDAIIREEEALKSRLLPAAVAYDKVQVQTSPSDQVADVMTSVVELDQKRGAIMRKLLKDMICAQELFDRMPTREYALLLRLRYADGKGPYTPWVHIAKVLGYSETYVKGRLHGDALEEARKYWPLKDDTE